MNYRVSRNYRDVLWNRRYNPAAIEYWQNVRKKVLERDLFTCQYPGCNEHQYLEVHHVQYNTVIDGQKVSIIGHEHKHLSCLVTLCVRHHDKAHGVPWIKQRMTYNSRRFGMPL